MKSIYEALQIMLENTKTIKRVEIIPIENG